MHWDSLGTLGSPASLAAALGRHPGASFHKPPVLAGEADRGARSAAEARGDSITPRLPPKSSRWKRLTGTSGTTSKVFRRAPLTASVLPTRSNSSGLGGGAFEQQGAAGGGVAIEEEGNAVTHANPPARYVTNAQDQAGRVQAVAVALTRSRDLLITRSEPECASQRRGPVAVPNLIAISLRSNKSRTKSRCSRVLRKCELLFLIRNSWAVRLDGDPSRLLNRAQTSALPRPSRGAGLSTWSFRQGAEGKCPKSFAGLKDIGFALRFRERFVEGGRALGAESERNSAEADAA